MNNKQRNTHLIIQISIFMNITQTFRRKNKYHKPILVFKELYRDYFKHTSPNKHHQPHLSEPLPLTTDKNKCFQKNHTTLIPKLSKTNSAEQLSKYLQNYGDPGTSMLKFTLQQESALKRSKSSQNSTYVFKLLERKQLQEMQREKRRYFSNSYTKSHPLFQKDHEFFKEKVLNEKENHIPKILPEIFKESDVNCKKPQQKRIQLQQLKGKFIGRRQMAVEKFEKIRHNFLLRKNYQPKAENEPSLTHRILCSSNLFEVTKENIFPSYES